MDALKLQIHNLSDELRRMYQWGLEDTPLFKKKCKELIRLQEKLDKANKVLNKYFKDIALEVYWYNKKL